MKKKGDKDKVEFRKSQEWKDFRKRLLEERGYICEHKGEI